MKLTFILILCLFATAKIILASRNHPNNPNFLKRVNTKGEFFKLDGENYFSDHNSLNSYIGICFIAYNSTIYDLSLLVKDEPFSIKSTKGNIIKFNICKNVVNSKECKNPAVEAMITSIHNSCVKYSDTFNRDKKWIFESRNSFSVLFPEGDVCNSVTGERFKVRLNLKCNEKADLPIILNSQGAIFNENACNNTINIETSEGKVNTLLIL